MEYKQAPEIKNIPRLPLSYDIHFYDDFKYLSMLTIKLTEYLPGN